MAIPRNLANLAPRLSTTGGSFSTTIGVGGATPSASGAGITFPASQSASTDANTLDDYEEGTWTPTLTPSTSGTITLDTSNDLMSYTKIGNRVFISGRVVVSSVASPVGAEVRIGNLPFSISDLSESAEGSASTLTMFDASVGAYLSPIAMNDGSNIFLTVFRIYKNAADMEASDQLSFSFCYVST